MRITFFTETRHTPSLLTYLFTQNIPENEQDVTCDDNFEFGGCFSNGVGGRDFDLARTATSQRLQGQRGLSFGGLDDGCGWRSQRLVFETPLHLGRRNAADLDRDGEAGSSFQLLRRLEFRFVVNRWRSYIAASAQIDILDLVILLWTQQQIDRARFNDPSNTS